MHSTLGDVALTSIGKETNKFPDFVQYIFKTKVLFFSSSSDVLLKEHIVLQLNAFKFLRKYDSF